MLLKKIDHDTVENPGEFKLERFNDRLSRAAVAAAGIRIEKNDAFFIFWGNGHPLLCQDSFLVGFLLPGGLE